MSIYSTVRWVTTLCALLLTIIGHVLYSPNGYWAAKCSVFSIPATVN